MKKIIILLLLLSNIFTYTNTYTDKYNKEIYRENKINSFFKAIRTKNLEYAKSFLEKSIKKEKLNKYDVEVLEDDYDIEINVNSKNKQGYTAIIVATESDNLEMIEYLIQEGANLNVSHPILNKPILAVAIHYNSNNTANYYIDNYKYLINQTSEVDLWTPLKEAVLKENKNILIRLLENGANIRQKDQNGVDVYALATRFGKGNMVKILRDFETKKGGK